jgi:hypothetical protein
MTYPSTLQYQNMRQATIQCKSPCPSLTLSSTFSSFDPTRQPCADLSMQHHMMVQNLGHTLILLSVLLGMLISKHCYYQLKVDMISLGLK